MRGPASRRVGWWVPAIGVVFVVGVVACTGPDPSGALRSPSVAGSTPPPPPPAFGSGERLPPNVILVVTDDQTAASMHGEPVAMPWLRRKLRAPGWTSFTNAVVTTPLCCPSRATILTGRYPGATGVRTNRDGEILDDTDTIATRLHDAGYRTALIGKYLNGYPWEDPPPVPPGWDRWFVKLNVSDATLYAGYDVVDEGERSTVGRGPEDYATDRLGAEAVRFVTEAPADRPFLLAFAPSAPHAPVVPAPRHADLLDAELAELGRTAPATLAAMNDVDGGPAWVRALAPIDPASADALAVAQVRERVALRAVDDALRALWRAVADRGDLDRTVWLFLSDNGYSFGDRRWVGKACPWETCIHVPFVAHVPGTPGGRSDALVASIDVAPTIAALAGVPAAEVDGVSLVPLLERGRPPARRGVLIDWIGDGEIPAWVGFRMPHAVLIRHADGTEELYDLATDPGQRRNLTEDAASARLRDRAQRWLDRSLAALGTGR